jgi:hypothetical protein
MRRLAHVLVAATSMLAALVIPSPVAPAEAVPGSARADAAFVQQMLFETPLRTFTRDAAQRVGPDGRIGDTWFDWTTDLCSAPLLGNSGRTFDFTEPCRRHDFGYRNTKLLEARYRNGAWSHASRKRIDQQLLADMLGHCRSRWIIDRPSCMTWAYTYYGAVRVAGGP